MFPVASRFHAAFESNVEKALAALQSSSPAEYITVFPHCTGEQFQELFALLSEPSSVFDLSGPGKLLKGLSGLEKLYFPSSTCIVGDYPRRMLTSFAAANFIYSKMMFLN